MLMRDTSLEKRILCEIRISIFRVVLEGKKCALYTVNTVDRNSAQTFLLLSYVSSCYWKIDPSKTVLVAGDIVGCLCILTALPVCL